MVRYMNQKSKLLNYKQFMISIRFYFPELVKKTACAESFTKICFQRISCFLFLSYYIDIYLIKPCFLFPELGLNYFFQLISTPYQVRTKSGTSLI